MNYFDILNILCIFIYVCVFINVHYMLLFFIDVVMFDASQAGFIHLHSSSQARPLLRFFILQW